MCEVVSRRIVSWTITYANASKEIFMKLGVLQKESLTWDWLVTTERFAFQGNRLWLTMSFVWTSRYPRIIVGRNASKIWKKNSWWISSLKINAEHLIHAVKEIKLIIEMMSEQFMSSRANIKTSYYLSICSYDTKIDKKMTQHWKALAHKCYLDKNMSQWRVSQLLDAYRVEQEIMTWADHEWVQKWIYIFFFRFLVLLLEI